METFQDEVLNKKAKRSETVLVKWNYNPIIQHPEFTVWSGKVNITGNVPRTDLERLERKINAIASELSVDDRIETIKGMMR